RGFCLALFAVASLVHASGWLPDRSWQPVLGWALALLLCTAMLLPRRTRSSRTRWIARIGEAAPVLARSAAAVLAAALLVLGQVHGALDARLPSGLEGVELEIEGMVEGMPSRFVFGDRVRFAVVSCRPLPPATGRDCGGLQRVQLDWGTPRERDRAGQGRGGGDEVWAHPGTWWRL